MNMLPGPAITPHPEGTLRTYLTVRVVDAFLMGTTNDSVRHDRGLHPVLLNEVDDLSSNCRTGSNILVFRIPSLDHLRLGALSVHDPHGNLGGPNVCWAVESNGRCWIATKATTRPLPERGI